MKISEIIKDKTKSEYIICILSLMIGVFLIYNSTYFIYAYHFTGWLFLMMFPMITLIAWLIIGLFLVLSSMCLLLSNNLLSVSLYKFSSTIIILYPFNEMLFNYYGDFILSSIIFLAGIFLYLFFNRKRYIQNEKLKIYIPLLGLFLYLCIDILFFSWCYNC